MTLLEIFEEKKKEYNGIRMKSFTEDQAITRIKECAGLNIEFEKKYTEIPEGQYDLIDDILEFNARIAFIISIKYIDDGTKLGMCLNSQEKEHLEHMLITVKQDCPFPNFMTEEEWISAGYPLGRIEGLKYDIRKQINTLHKLFRVGTYPDIVYSYVEILDELVKEAKERENIDLAFLSHTDFKFLNKSLGLFKNGQKINKSHVDIGREIMNHYYN